MSGRWDRRPQSAADARFGKTHVGTCCFESLLARQDETGVDGVSLGTMDEHDTVKEKQNYSALTKKSEGSRRQGTLEVAHESEGSGGAEVGGGREQGELGN